MQQMNDERNESVIQPVNDALRRSVQLLAAAAIDQQPALGVIAAVLQVPVFAAESRSIEFLHPMQLGLVKGADNAHYVN